MLAEGGVVAQATGGSTSRTEGSSQAQHGLEGQVFDVETGNGITNEIQDYARTHGYREVSSGQAWMLYENMRQRFGTTLINSIGKSTDTYIRTAGDVGISHPGPAVWPKDVEDFLRQRLSPVG
jgi:hypothetical protein